MWFVFCAASISVGGMIGGILGKRINVKSFSVLSIGIMLISAVGLLENIICISDGRVVGEHTVLVVLALIFGYAIGDALKLEDRIYSLSKSQKTGKHGFVDSVLFFGIGGLQISGPILYVLGGDGFQLAIKAMVDFPFALILGATYGKRVALSSLPVMIMQLAIAALAYCFGDFMSPDFVSQICSFGYLMLFFSGFNMICSPEHKIKNVNMLPGMLLIIGYNLILEVFIR